MVRAGSRFDGRHEAERGMNEGLEEMEEAIDDILTEGGWYKALNQVIDDIVTFQPLKPEALQQIVEIQLKRLRSRLKPIRIKLEVNSQALAWLAQRGWDPEYGARPLKRTLQRQLENPLSKLLLEGNIHPGTTIEAGVENDQITLTVV